MLKIYNKKLASLFIILCAAMLPCFAIQKGSVKFNDDLIDYSVLNGEQILSEADSFFDQYETSGDTQDLTTAMGKYYIATKLYPLEMYPVVQLARTYDEKNLDRFAKQYFNIGYDIDKKDPYLNYYYGEFYFKRNDYKRALRFYKNAFNNGYSEYYDLNVKIATIYEKFADLVNAKYYYERAYSLEPSNTYPQDKALEIESLNYDQSEYYKRK